MEAYALSKYNRISTKKLRRVVLSIHGMRYGEAMDLLRNLPHKGARILECVLKSASSNLENKGEELDEENWYIRKVVINRGPYFKRLKIRARGRSDRINKPMSHIMVVISSDERGKGKEKKN